MYKNGKNIKKRSKKSKISRKKSIKKITSFQEYEKVGEQVITRKAFLKYSLAQFKNYRRSSLKIL